MGKGDKKTRRGKFFLGSYGVKRPRKRNEKVAHHIVDQEEKEKS